MKKVTESAADIVRKCIDEGIESAVISSPRNTAQNQERGGFDKIRIRSIQLKNGASYQLEQFRGQKVFHRNVHTVELSALLEEWLEKDYSRAEITTRVATVHVLANRKGELTSIRKSKERSASTNDEKSQIQNHNRTKNYILKEGIPVPFLIDLGVMTEDGTVVKAKYDKFRQINRFLEFIADVESELRAIAEQKKDGDTLHEITIVDFGCGKSYLTFAVYYYLTILQKLPVKIIGLDLKEEVIAQCSTLATSYGYTGLHFAVGDIATYSGAPTADMVISLHACDTATDFALAQAVRWNARVILAVPCCQHEANAQLAEKSAVRTSGAILAPAFKHGIIRERIAALFTDVLRAELLESHGYRVQILEFIDMSHTPKNLLLRAIREESSHSIAANEDSQNEGYRLLRDFLGVKPTLEKELLHV